MNKVRVGRDHTTSKQGPKVGAQAAWLGIPGAYPFMFPLQSLVRLFPFQGQCWRVRLPKPNPFFFFSPQGSLIDHTNDSDNPLGFFFLFILTSTLELTLMMGSASRPLVTARCVAFCSCPPRETPDPSWESPQISALSSLIPPLPARSSSRFWTCI